MRTLVSCLLIALVILHQWDPFREDATLIAGALPVVLVYHVGVSLAAAAVWVLAARFAWPDVAEPAERDADA